MPRSASRGIIRTNTSAVASASPSAVCRPMTSTPNRAQTASSPWRASGSGSRTADSRQQHGVEGDRLHGDARGLGGRSQEREVEGQLVTHEHRRRRVLGEVGHHVRSPSGVGDEVVGDAMEAGGQLRDRPAGVDQRVERVVPTNDAAVDADGGDRHEPVAGLRMQTGGLRVHDGEDDVGQGRVEPLVTVRHAARGAGQIEAEAHDRA